MFHRSSIVLEPFRHPCTVFSAEALQTRLWSHTWGWLCKALNYWDVFLGDISFHLVLELFSSFSSRSYPPVRNCTDYCGMNMSTNIALKTRTRCYSFDQYVRKCNDSLVVNMMNKNALYFRTEWYLLCYCCCVKHLAHRNSKSRVYPLQCQDLGPPTWSYTAAAGVAVRCCCCCGLNTRTHTRTVPMTSGWRVYIVPFFLGVPFCKNIPGNLLLVIGGNEARP